jgi:hypothetical protein
MDVRLQIVNLFIMQIFPSSTQFLPLNSNISPAVCLRTLAVSALSSSRGVVYNNG